MQCNCNPPASVALRSVQKQGENNGREFFACHKNRCNFFLWAGMSNTALRDGSLTKGSILAEVKKAVVQPPAGMIQVKFSVAKIEAARAWFNVQCPSEVRLLQLFKEFSTDCEYNSALKMWRFDIKVHDSLSKKLKSNEFASFVNLSNLPSFLVEGILQYISKNCLNRSIQISISKELHDQLLPFQVEGVEFVIRNGGRALIADEMGCGKSIQAIAVMEHYKSLLPVLVLVPPNLVLQWQQELIKFGSSFVCEKDICVIRTSADKIRGKVCIVPYSLLDKISETVHVHQFGIVIADESHNLKNRDAKRTSMALPFLRNAEIAVCLSGTPSLNRPVELFTQLNALLPYVFSNYNEFTKRYCDAKPCRFKPGLDVSGSSNESELKAVLEGLVMIRRLKSEVVNNMPEKNREVRYVKPDDFYINELKVKQQQASVVDAALKNPHCDSNILQKLRNEQQSLLNDQYSITGRSKIKRVVEIVIEIINELREKDQKDTLALIEEDNSSVENELWMNDSKTSKSSVSTLWKDIFNDTGSQSKGYSNRKYNMPSNSRVEINQKQKAFSKVLVFAHHKVVMDDIEDSLRKLGVTCMRIDGQVPNNARHTLIKSFQEENEPTVALLSLTACGIGLNLTRASVTIFAELAWSPGIIMQAEDRIHRLGQKSKRVKIVYIIASGTADDIVWRQIQRKHKTIEATVGYGNKLQSSTSTVDLMPIHQRVSDGPMDSYINKKRNYIDGNLPIPKKNHLELASFNQQHEIAEIQEKRRQALEKLRWTREERFNNNIFCDSVKLSID